MGAKLYFGRVMHHRLRPAEHRFVYPVFFMRVPLSDPHSLAGPLFGVNRPKLFSFMFRDHGARDGSAPIDWIRALLEREGLDAADGEVWLQAFPRVLGYVFNPVSFWFCHDRAGALRAILCEVNNTFGETHHYLLAEPGGGPIPANAELAARKVFHVSPFCAIEGGYRFRFGDAGGRVLAGELDEGHGEDGGQEQRAQRPAHRAGVGRAADFQLRGLLAAQVLFFGLAHQKIK